MRCWCGGGVGPSFNDGAKGENVCLESKYHAWDSDGRPETIEVLYLAGPMSGRAENNYPAFNIAAEHLRAAGYAVINPAESGPGGRVHYVDLLRDDLKELLDCDAVAMLPDWWESTGARNEVAVAGLLRMPCRTVSDWLELARRVLA